MSMSQNNSELRSNANDKALPCFYFNAIMHACTIQQTWGHDTDKIKVVIGQEEQRHCSAWRRVGGLGFFQKLLSRSPLCLTTVAAVSLTILPLQYWNASANIKVQKI